MTVLIRDLGWSVGGTRGGTSPGSYAILESIRAALTGYQIPGARKIFLLSEKFLERANRSHRATRQMEAEMLKAAAV